MIRGVAVSARHRAAWSGTGRRAGRPYAAPRNRIPFAGEANRTQELSSGSVPATAGARDSSDSNPRAENASINCNGGEYHP